MRVIILGKGDTAAYQGAHELVIRKGHQVVESGDIADLAIAPLLTERLSPAAIYAPKHGTLIFHPSPLPHGRGASAIRWAYERREPITAATWFWANLYKMDSGSICEQEVIKIDHSQRPREFYAQHILPAMLRTLERALDAIAVGYVRRVPQVETYATFDYTYRKCPE